MPIPEPHTPWPPPGHGKVHDTVYTWSAWFEGDRDALARAYGGAAPAPYGEYGRFFASERGDRMAQYRGGVVGRLARWFWGEPLSPEQRSPKLHIPVAADIATTSGDLLFGEAPTVTVDDDATRDRLDTLLDERVWAQLLHAAEMSAGLGGAYVRVGWDRDFAPRPLLSVIGPDVAAPVFRWQALSEVTFGWVLHRGERDEVLRHLEHHALGSVEHALFLGEGRDLGRRVPLTEHESTAELVGSLSEDGVVETGLPGLDVVYVPNRPHRGWRNHPQGRDQGQPDIAGVEPVLDALDEAWTSWMRDLRLGKARAVVPQNYLDTHGRGQGASFDLDRELFVGVNALAGTDQMPLHVVQPAIRHAEHAATVTALVERAITVAGYSAQTFGLTGEVAMTAAESYARERKTHQTRAGKIRRWRPALADLVEIMLAVDSLVFRSPVKVLRPEVEFAPIARDNPEALARTSQLLLAAEAASTRTRVATAHPDWDEERVADEVALIAGEQPATPNPDTGFTTDDLGG